MSLAVDKMHWMSIADDYYTVSIHVDGHLLHSSPSFIYLGAFISFQGALAHLDFRCRRMLTVWGKLHRALRSSGASRDIQIKAANVVALPSLLWTLHAFPITTNILLKLQSMFLPVFRSIFGNRSANIGSNWILLHSFIRQQFNQGILISPAMELYKQQEKLALISEENLAI